MRLFALALLGTLALPGSVLAQGTKDPSNPVPTMPYVVQSPSGPTQPTTVPTRPYAYPYPYYPRPTPHLRRIHPGRMQHMTR